MLFKKPSKKERTTITTEDLGYLPIPRLLRYYTIPSLVGAIVNSLYNVVDRIFIGQGVNSLAISGLAVTFPILIFLQAFGVLIGVGTSARISILLGQGRRDEAENLLGNSFILSIITSLVAIALMMFFLDDLLYSFGASEATIPYARDYLSIVIPGNIFANLTYSYNAVMRSTGYPRKAMITMIIGALLNALLDPLFLFGFGWGIKGVAWATVISMFVGMCYVMHHFVDKRSLLNIRPQYFRLKWKYIISIISIGVAPFAMQFTASFVNVIKNTSLLTYGGDYAVGAYGIVNSLATLVIMIMLGLSLGMQPIIGYNYGSGKMQRVKEAYYTTRRLNVLIGLVSTLLALFLPRTLAKAFTLDPQLIDVAEVAIRLELLALWAVGYQSTTTQFFQSLGYASRAVALSLSRQIIFLTPLLLILPRCGLGLKGVWIAAPVSDLLSCLSAIIMMLLFRKRFQEEEQRVLSGSEGVPIEPSTTGEGLGTHAPADRRKGIE